MIFLVPLRTLKLKERGPTPRRLRRAMTRAQKSSWEGTGQAWHQERRDLRFTKEHARAARYKKRAGENLPRGTRAYRRSYTGIKERRFGHTRPMEFSGRTRRAVRIARIAAVSKGVTIRYTGANVLNFRNRFSNLRPSEEFRRFTRDDEQFSIRTKDRLLDRSLKNDTVQTTTDLV